MKYKEYDKYYGIIDCGGLKDSNLRAAELTLKKKKNIEKICLIFGKEGKIVGGPTPFFENMSIKEVGEAAKRLYNDIQKNGQEIEMNY